MYLDFRGPRVTSSAEVKRYSKPASQKLAGFFISGSVMRSSALPSSQYADPMRVLEAKQAREANAQKRAEAKRPTITLKRGEWSEARKRAEALFDFPAAPGSKA